MKRIAFIVQLPRNVSPGQRFRFEIWEPTLTGNKFQVDTFSFFDDRTYRVLYEKGFVLKKILGVISGFLRRFFLLFKLWKYDFIMLQREFAPVGPPFFEWITAKILRRKIIYDFDDAIWIPNTSAENKLAGLIKCFWKVKYICKWSYKVVGGNDYLCAFARQFNDQVIRIPTCVDTKNAHYKLKQSDADSLTIGWTGSHSTLKYLDQVIPVIDELQSEFDFKFLVIADKRPILSLANWKYIPWNILTETEDLLSFDIGIMPLIADEWSEGKCGFKLIQYFACGIPGVASAVGVNKIIVEHGINGFLCCSKDEWRSALKSLLSDQSLRDRMGKAGRKKIEEQYSIQSQEAKFIQLFSEL